MTQHELIVPNGMISYDQQPELVTARPTDIALYDGEAAVLADNPNFSARKLSCTVLAGLGIVNGAIAASLALKPYTVKTHVDNGLSALRLPNRSAVLRHYLANGDVKIIGPARPLDAKPIELAIVEHISWGDSNLQVGKQLYLSHHTIKTYIQRVSERNMANNRTDLVARGLLSKQISFDSTR